jgi:hypothetical protein
MFSEFISRCFSASSFSASSFVTRCLGVIASLSILLTANEVFAQDVAAGKSLWDITCATGGGCHSTTTPFATRPVVKPKGDTAAGIQQTINSNTGGMGILRALTNAQLTDIAAYIASSTSGAKATQTITFTQPAAARLGSGVVALQATASSSLPVSFGSQTANICTVSGSSVTLVAVGNCTIRASQAGNGSFDAAAPVDRTFAIQSSATVTPNANYSGWWWNASESGWGINLTQNPANSKVFAALFAYGAPATGATSSPGLFYTIIIKPAGWTTPNSFDADVTSYTGPNFRTSTFPQGSIGSKAEGTARVTFTSATAGTIVFTWADGTTQTKNLVPFPVE